MSNNCCDDKDQCNNDDDCCKNESEEFKVQGKELLEKVKDLLKEGNIRKITIKDKNNNVILSIPLTFGIIGAVLAPVLAAIGAVAALVTECTISVERRK
jgi:phage-related minor tail protein